jgi:hypothetical protein
MLLDSVPQSSTRKQLRIKYPYTVAAEKVPWIVEMASPQAFPSLPTPLPHTQDGQCKASVARKRVCEQITGHEYKTYSEQVQREDKSVDRLDFFPTSQNEKLTPSNFKVL